ncbi:MAG: hypothetical protein KBC96_08470 [Armatimonadetes bacterium]|nr:hypothetical protein [Armatimonadota bacterium]
MSTEGPAAKRKPPGSGPEGNWEGEKMLLSELIYCRNRAKSALGAKILGARAQKKNPRVMPTGLSKEGEKDVAFPGRIACKIRANPRDRVKYVRYFIRWTLDVHEMPWLYARFPAAAGQKENPRVMPAGLVRKEKKMLLFQVRVPARFVPIRVFARKNLEILRGWGRKEGPA